MKRMFEKLLAQIEVYSYRRVLRDCEYILTKEQKMNVIANIENAKLKYSSI
jgi:hypothetical protein